MPNFDNFKKGLKENYDMEYDNVKNNWKYCGGNKGRHLNYYTLMFNGAKLPELENKCVCGHNIIENCFITDNTELLVLGNCCIKAFVKKCNRNCGDTHLNRKINKCNVCKRKYCIICKEEKNPNYLKYKKCYNCYMDT
jgi:hypothetical protein